MSISPRILIQILWFLIMWIRIQVIFLKILKSLISQLVSLSDLIDFKEYIKNTFILRGFDPYSSLYDRFHLRKALELGL